ncbi:MAG: hypothetical protein JWO38_1321 [Gemmataceae bacterium]|nr:hypothetical protein [Gemmataceae bacterium]
MPARIRNICGHVPCSDPFATESPGGDPGQYSLVDPAIVSGVGPRPAISVMERPVRLPPSRGHLFASTQLPAYLGLIFGGLGDPLPCGRVVPSARTGDRVHGNC